MNEEQPIIEAGPPTLNHVIGQQRAVRQLRTALDAHFNDRMSGNSQALPHLLFVGPPGVGKSLLSQIIARELGSTLHEELAQNLSSPSQLHGLLMMANEGDVIFLDETHELKPVVMTSLYRALEERKLFLGGERHSIFLPSITVIGATTDEWQLSKPLRDRFKITLRLEHYSSVELEHLVSQRAKRLGWPIDEDAVNAIAFRGRGTPRLAIRLLEATHRTARADNADSITPVHVDRMCDIEGIDTMGLDSTEQKYLHLVREAQGPVRLNVLATQLGLPRRTIEGVIESELIRLGLVTKSEEGRMLTGIGAAHVAGLSSL